MFTLVKNKVTNTPSTSILFDNTDSKYAFLYPLSSVIATLILVIPLGSSSFTIISPAAGLSKILKDFTLYTEPGNVNLLANTSPIWSPALYTLASFKVGNFTWVIPRITVILHLIAPWAKSPNGNAAVSSAVNASWTAPCWSELGAPYTKDEFNLSTEYISWFSELYTSINTLSVTPMFSWLPT